MSMCPRCATASAAITPADRRCSFDQHGHFREGGHGCITLALLMETIIFKHATINEALEMLPRREFEVIVNLLRQGLDAPVEIAEVYRIIGGRIVREPLTLQAAEEVLASRAPQERRAAAL